MASKLAELLLSSKIFIFNLSQMIYSKLSDEEISLVKNCTIFKNCNHQVLNEILKNAQLKKYLKNELILEEGVVGDAMFIIAEGSVRVFTTDTLNNKIPLARLNKGDYFGEQSLISTDNNTRNASVESITDVLLISIDDNLVKKVLDIDSKLLEELKKIGDKQIIEKLSSVLETYHLSKTKLLELYKQSPINIIQVPAKKILFSSGDKPDYVYFILEGEVELLISMNKGAELKAVVLTKGHIFGELSVIRGSNRTGSAIAKEKLKLLAIPASEFKALYLKDKDLQKALKSFHESYWLPNRGLAQQFIGKTLGINIITTIYKLINGKTINASRTIYHDYFSMFVEGATADNTYVYENNQIKIELKTFENTLIEIKSHGYLESLPVICSYLIDGKTIEEQDLQQFLATGIFQPSGCAAQNDNDAIICTCMSISKGQILKCIGDGINKFEDISKKTGASTVCGTCRHRILALLGQTNWTAGLMTKAVSHNEYIRSYFIQPLDGSFKNYKPGQHVLIQARIHNHWIERAYTISDVTKNNILRITVKKEDKGYFSNWLFNEAPDECTVNVSQPQGNFILDPGENQPAICFAGGIGITPFISFAKAFLEQKSPRKVHIVYSARQNQDFIFMDEFQEAMTESPNISLHTHLTSKQGRLTNENIVEMVQELGQPDVYICGPEGYEKHIVKALEQINYNKNKVHVEQFTFVGPQE